MIMNTPLDGLPVVVIGAGPVGLANVAGGGGDRRR
jgi:hypothetical protein